MDRADLCIPSTMKFENTTQHHYSRKSNRDRSPVQQRLSGCGARDQSGVLRGMMNPPEPGRMEGQDVSEVASESGPAVAMPPKNSSDATSKAPQRDDVECDTQVCFRVSPRSSCKENPNVPRVSLQRHEYVRFLRAEIPKIGWNFTHHHCAHHTTPHIRPGHLTAYLACCLCVCVDGGRWGHPWSQPARSPCE